ncbi:predicted protein [Phaeodactylum tricornutum CCAP 1055/1]|jgi:hypothetical protein|uniref:Uncharacterized protein n=1 Tax=Phaeodactylum tricornutum (strain CCAP 1055/1) TaxID=556484 RepID=B7GA49_PHATC|nr:predicted protein [Phaeodactylum tricornutum CCAP 1055/1]EEC44676.1 predicted protein [Phaeodactylum tricornutum CCAP 1055/1]|eukprot:XP_002184007.1 predicted protein [Phaeodactylum tricornutum CCAP 1055/1]
MARFLSLVRSALLLAVLPMASSDMHTFDSEHGVPTHRDMQSSAYSITFDSVTNSGNNVTVTFNHGNGGAGEFEIYVKTGSATTSQYNLTCYSEGGTLFSGDGISSLTPTIGTASSTFEFSFDDNVDETDPFYFGDVNTLVEGTAQLILCVKFTLTEVVDSSPIDVNYREVAIAIDITLDGDLATNSTQAFEVSAAEVSVDQDGTIEYTAKAELCSSFSGTVTPGVAVPICIKTSDYPLSRIISVQDLSFKSGSITQDIRSEGADATGAGNFYGLIASTADGHCVINECIQYDVLVYAIFATGDDLQVDILGNVVLGIGDSRRTLRARLEPSRNLQEIVRTRAFRSTIYLPGLSSGSVARSSLSGSWTAPVLALGSLLLSLIFLQ